MSFVWVVCACWVTTSGVGVLGFFVVYAITENADAFTWAEASCGSYPPREGVFCMFDVTQLWKLECRDDHTTAVGGLLGGGWTVCVNVWIVCVLISCSLLCWLGGNVCLHVSLGSDCVKYHYQICMCLLGGFGLGPIAGAILMQAPEGG